MRSCGQRSQVALGSLTEAQGLRVGGLDPGHVGVLAELGGRWPPVLVWGPDNQIVDGYHRVAAARKLGLKSLEVEWFEGPAEATLIEAIRRNAKHGLPLTLRDRSGAAERVLSQQPQWSDRRIGLLCGLTAKTVARIRLERGGQCAEIPEHAARVGIDGRVRPSRPNESRRRVLRALEQNPHGSLRSIASIAEVSPETVRKVRRALQEGSRNELGPASEDDTVFTVVVFDRDEGKRPVSAVGLPAATDREPMAWEPTDREPVAWEPDVALSTCASADGLLEWLSSGSVYEWPAFVDHVPLGRIYEVAEECRRRAQAWATFARALEARALPRNSVAS